MQLSEFLKLLPVGVTWTMKACNRKEHITEVVVRQPGDWRPTGGQNPDTILLKGYGVNPEIAMSNTILNLDIKAIGGIASFFKHKVPWYRRKK